MIRLKVSAEYEGARLDRFALKATSLGKSTVQKLLRKGDIKLNGKKAVGSIKLSENDEVVIYAAEKRPADVRFIEGLPKPEVLYEDEFILAVNKPAGLNSQPAVKGEDCLSERIKLYLKQYILQNKGMFVPGTVNRLDRNTSGVVLSAKTPNAARELNELMREGKIDKTYLALVAGEFPRTIRAEHYALKDVANNMMTLYDTPGEGRVRMISVFSPISSSEGFTLIKAKLITGKTHQIRAQLKALGYPVVCDYKYADMALNRAFSEKYQLKRMFLHCVSTALPLWYSAGRLKVSCALPQDLNDVLQKIGITLSEEEILGL